MFANDFCFYLYSKASLCFLSFLILLVFFSITNCLTNKYTQDAQRIIRLRNETICISDLQTANLAHERKITLFIPQNISKSTNQWKKSNYFLYFQWNKKKFEEKNETLDREIEILSILSSFIFQFYLFAYYYNCVWSSKETKDWIECSYDLLYY